MNRSPRKWVEGICILPQLTLFFCRLVADFCSLRRMLCLRGTRSSSMSVYKSAHRIYREKQFRPATDTVCSLLFFWYMFRSIGIFCSSSSSRPTIWTYSRCSTSRAQRFATTHTHIHTHTHVRHTGWSWATGSYAYRNCCVCLFTMFRLPRLSR